LFEGPASKPPNTRRLGRTQLSCTCSP